MMCTHWDRKAVTSFCRGRWHLDRCIRSQQRRQPGARCLLWSENCTCLGAPALSTGWRSATLAEHRAQGVHTRCDRRPCRSRAIVPQTQHLRDIRQTCRPPTFRTGSLFPWSRRSWSRSGTPWWTSRPSRRWWTRRLAMDPTTRPRRAASTRPESRAWPDEW